MDSGSEGNDMADEDGNGNPEILVDEEDVDEEEGGEEEAEELREGEEGDDEDAPDVGDDEGAESNGQALNSLTLSQSFPKEYD